MEFKVTDAESYRLDKYLTKKIQDHSRSEVQDFIKEGMVTINDHIVLKPHGIIHKNDIIMLDLNTIKRKRFEQNNLNIFNDLNSNLQQHLYNTIKVIYQNDDFIIIDKPAGLLVHRTNNPNSYSLVEFLIQHYPEIKGVGEKLETRNARQDDNQAARDGIVHRIDKNTSGLLIVARNQNSYTVLKELFLQRQIHKTYLCLVRGLIKQTQGVVTFPITRSKLDHTKRVAMMKESDNNFYQTKRSAITEYEVLNHYTINNQVCCLLKVILKTGRTHQIRVHMKAIGHPIFGDKLYGGKFEKTNSLLKRQFLHASELKFIFKNREYHFKSELAPDLKDLLSI